MIFIDISSMVLSHMQEFTLGPLSGSRSAPGGCVLIGQAANCNRNGVKSPLAKCIRKFICTCMTIDKK